MLFLCVSLESLCQKALFVSICSKSVLKLGLPDRRFSQPSYLVQFFFHVTFVRFLQLPAGRFFVFVFFDVGDWVTGDTQPSTINLRTNYYKIQNIN
jgi:hypothetical protein